MRFHLSLLFVLLAAGRVAALEGPALQAWQEDLAMLLKEFPERDRSLTPAIRAEFTRHVEDLQDRLPELDEHHVIVGVIQALALARNAHTSAQPPPDDLRLTAVPIRLHWFSDGVYVVKARPQHANLLRGRLVSIGGHSVDDLMAKLRSLFYGNRTRERVVGPHKMVVPGLLYGLDLTPDPNAFEIVIETSGGEMLKETLTAESVTPTESWQAWYDLAPARKRNDSNWVFAFDPAETPTPLYLKDPNTVFWLEYLESPKTLYIQYNSSLPQPPAKPGDYLDRTLEAIETHDVRRVIVDLRFNAGGNLMLMRTAFGRMLREDVFKQPGALYVITGPITFSAGLFHAANLKQNGSAIIVGDLVGDDLDFWAEGRPSFTLPNSNIRIAAQTGFHSYSKAERPEFAESLYLDLGLDTLEPDIPAPISFDDYLSGRDPSLDAILAAVAGS